jgi:pSer/pThr/pTyr-binding forkhead associated (FHA) protein
MSEALEFLDHRTRRQALAPSLAPSGRYLSLDDGDGPRLLALKERITHIGRGLTADIRADDHRVARLHAIIVLHPDGARLLDGRSASGTLLNGQPVLAAELQSGDEITLGPITMRYVELRAYGRPRNSAIRAPTTSGRSRWRKCPTPAITSAALGSRSTSPARAAISDS